MKILVTGGAGYIGSHAIKELEKAGYNEILVIDNLEYGHREAILPPAKLKVLDLRDREELINEISSYAPDVVMHFAAYTDAAESVEEPKKYFENNVRAGINLLDAMVASKVKKIIFSSSAAVYGNAEKMPVDEKTKAIPTNPYGETKLEFEKALVDYEIKHGIKSISLRYFNVAGADPDGEIGNSKREKNDVVSILLKCAKENDNFTVFGTDYDTKDGTPVRDFIHVSDLARAHVDALKYLGANNESNIFNLGSDHGFTMKEMAETVKRVTKSSFNIQNGPRRQGDIAVSIASSDRAKKVLKWQPKYSDIKNIITTAWEWEGK